MNKIFLSKKVLLLVFILSGITFIITLCTTYIDYLTTVKLTKITLLDDVESEKQFIKALFDKSIPKDSIINIIKSINQNKRSLGPTAEFAIAELNNDSIYFICRKDTQVNSVIYFSKDEKKQIATPMHLALSGKQGAIEGIDYRKELVFAGYSYYAPLKWGIVSKINVSEIYRPFYDSLLFSLIFALVFTFFGALLFIKITNPMIANILKSEEQLSITLNSIGDGVIATDENGIVLNINPVAAKLCGLKVKEAHGKPLNEIFNIINAGTREKVINPVKKVIETGEIIGLANHTVLISKDGSEYQISDSAAPIKNKEGKISGVVLTFSDITESYEADAALKEIESRYNTFVNTHTDLIFIKDEKLRYIMVNDATCKFFGRNRDEILLKTDYDLMDESGAIVCEQTDKLIFSSDSPVVNEEIIGERIYESTKFSLLFKDNQIGIGAIIRDITDKKKSEEIIKKNERFLKETQKIAQLGTYTMNVSTGIWDSSEILDSIFGIDKEYDKSVFGWVNILHPEWQQIMNDYLLNEVFGKKIKFDKEYKIIRQNDKTERWLHGFGDLKFNENGEPILMIGAIQDITERKKAEELLHLQNQELEAQYEEYMQLNEILRLTNFNLNIAKAKAEESENRLKLATASGLLGIWDWNVKDNVMVWDDRMFELYGIGHDIFPNNIDAWMNGLHPEDKQRAIEECNAALNGEMDFDTTFRVLHPDGKVLYLKANALVIKDNKGNPIRMIGINSDFTERKQAEESLRESEETYRMLFDSINDAIMISEIKNNSKLTNFVKVNNIACQRLGYTEEELLSKTPLEINSAKSIEEVTKLLPEFIAKGQVLFEAEHVAKDGKIIPVEISAKVGKYKNKTVFLSIARDITQRKLNEKSLVESEERFKMLFDQAPLGYQSLDFDGNFIDVNQRWLDTLGYERNEVIGKWFGDFLTPAYKQGFLNRFPLFKELGKIHSEFEMLHKNGDVIFIAFDGRIGNDINGVFKQTHCILKDITEQKRAEIALQQSEEKYRKVVDNIHEALIIEDIEGRLVYANEEFCNIFGFTTDDLSSLTLKDYISPDSYIEIIERHKKRMQGISVPEEFVYQGMRKDGKTLWIESRVTPLFENNVIIGTQSLERDITERKKAEELLHLKNQELEAQYEEYMQLNEILRQTNYNLEISKEKSEESDRLKTAFLQNMSHEIRTPLNGILGFSKLLQYEDINKEDIKEYTGIIQQSGQRLLEMVNNVLDISKIETGQIEIHYKSFSINAMLSDLYSFFISSANSKGLNLAYHTFLENKNSIISADESILYQILTNLINNAIKFTSSGRIDYGYEIKDNVLEFYVKDTGSGISQEHFEKLFFRFTQLDLSITRGFEGAGLGLSICKGLVELLGGRIWLESELKKGTTFYFTIPLIYQDNINLQGFNELKKEVNITRSTILIAEDDLISFKYLKKLLTGQDTTIIWAENGKQAIEIVKNNQAIDLILMDIRMPVLSGIEAIKQIKKIKPDLPVIAQTAYAFNEEKEKILSYGFSDFISKPIDKDKILMMINKYLKRND